MKSKILILAYPGSGKTFIADNYNDVSDLEFQHYRWDYGEYKNLPLEQLKGRKDLRTNNPLWPYNFFEDLDKEIESKCLVFVPLATSLLEHAKFLKESKGVRVIFAIPTRERFKEIISVYKNRDNSKLFIESRIKDYDKFYDIVKNSEFEKLYIEKGEFLFDGIKILEFV